MRLTFRQQRGRAGERLARSYLQRHGYVIQASNVRYPVGEVDLVAQESGTLCFIEVRLRSSRGFGTALESVTARKQRRCVQAARWYVKTLRSWTGPIRFDVLAIQQEPGAKPAIELVRGAFDAVSW